MMRKKRSDLSSSTIKSCVPVVDEWTDGERKIICQVFFKYIDCNDEKKKE